MMNLIYDRWIPIRRNSGKEERVAPWQITEPDDPIVAMAARRPDFNGALIQFLIGLLQTAVSPKNETVWENWLDSPPAPEILKECFAQYAHAFNLDGDGPRFMQDIEQIEGSEKNINALLIDSPGQQALEQNKDHFVKQGTVQAICPSCAATALFTLQTNAPSGGVGHRTSLRGGGPLTTLVILDPKGSNLAVTLWRNVWLNVLSDKALIDGASKGNTHNNCDIFPWLAPTRTSEKGSIYFKTTLLDTNPLQMYWGMPRRIRIIWEKTASGSCDICGTNSDFLVHTFITKSYGINYEGPWQHFLSPHFINKDLSPNPVHAQPGGMSYRHWLRLIQGSDTYHPAQTVSSFSGRKLQKEQLRVWAFGYDMDNMKPRCWYEVTYPLYLLPDETRPEFEGRVFALVDTATQVATMVRTCIKEAWFGKSGDVKGDTGFLVEAFFHSTEQEFYETLARLVDAVSERDKAKQMAELQQWHRVLQRAALAMFDYWAARGDIAFGNPRRISIARGKLIRIIKSSKIREPLHVSKRKEKTV